MKLPILNIKQDQITDIPDIFYSTATDSLFTYCISCNKNLLENDTDYVIEKAVRNYKDYNADDVIFEYAMCTNCLEKMRKSLSEESRNKVDNYFDQNINLVQRREDLIKDNKLDLNDWLSNCVIKGKSMSHTREYQIICQCRGTKMFFSYLPYMICDEAMEEVMMLLSNKTLGEINGFIDDFLGVPPEFKKLLKDDPVFIL